MVIWPGISTDLQLHLLDSNMNQLSLIQEAGKAFSQATDRETAFLAEMKESNARQLFLRHIQSRLSVWWEKEPEQIPRLLYRIDVEEELARKALMSDQPVENLAIEILNRLEKTAQSRLDYRMRKTSESP